MVTRICQDGPAPRLSSGASDKPALENALSANASPSIYPVVDYEPPAFGGPPTLPPVSKARPQRRTAAPPIGRSPAEQERARTAAAFADAALRRVLEVLDRRRPVAQLRHLLAAGLADSLLSAARRCVPAGGVPARLRRVSAQPIGEHVAEVAASYVRGERVHAIACRIERVGTPTGPRWQVTALHMG